MVTRPNSYRHFELPHFLSWQDQFCMLLLLAACVLGEHTICWSDTLPDGDGSQDSTTSETFTINVRLVNIPFSMRARHEPALTTIKKEDFEVFEDGKLRTVKYIKSEADRPITLGIVFSTNISDQLLRAEQQSIAGFLRNTFRAQDLAFVIGFSSSVELRQDLTSSVSEVSHAISINRREGRGEAPTEPTWWPSTAQVPQPTSVFYDAAYLAAEKLAHEAGRKIVILVGDGEDRGSLMKFGDTLHEAVAGGIAYYTIAIPAAGTVLHHYYPFDMVKLAKETGGRAFILAYFNPSKPGDLTHALDEIHADLRNQYSIGFIPGRNQQRSFHRVKIKSRNGNKILAPAGYYSGYPK